MKPLALAGQAGVMQATDVEKLAAARVSKHDDCKDTTPVDLLRALVADILSGKIEVTALVVCYTNVKEFGTYRCNVNRLEQVALLELCKDQSVRRYRGEMEE